MARPPRITEPGVVYHLLNRRVMRFKMFGKDQDDQTFQQALAESLEKGVRMILLTSKTSDPLSGCNR